MERVESGGNPGVSNNNIKENEEERGRRVGVWGTNSDKYDIGKRKRKRKRRSRCFGANRPPH